MEGDRRRMFCSWGRGDFGDWGDCREAGLGLGGAILSQERPPLVTAGGHSPAAPPGDTETGGHGL